MSIPSHLDTVNEREPYQRLVPIREAALFLSVSVSTLYGWVWQRRIPFVKIGRALRFDLRDLEALVEANRQVPPQKSSSSDGRPPRCYNTGAAGKG